MAKSIRMFYQPARGLFCSVIILDMCVWGATNQKFLFSYRGSVRNMWFICRKNLGPKLLLFSIWSLAFGGIVTFFHIRVFHIRELNQKNGCSSSAAEWVKYQINRNEIYLQNKCKNYAFSGNNFRKPCSDVYHSEHTRAYGETIPV